VAMAGGFHAGAVRVPEVRPQGLQQDDGSVDGLLFVPVEVLPLGAELVRVLHLPRHKL
jgi:hypothetical protein